MSTCDLEGRVRLAPPASSTTTRPIVGVHNDPPVPCDLDPIHPPNVAVRMDGCPARVRFSSRASVSCTSRIVVPACHHPGRAAQRPRSHTIKLGGEKRRRRRIHDHPPPRTTHFPRGAKTTPARPTFRTVSDHRITQMYATRPRPKVHDSTRVNTRRSTGTATPRTSVICTIHAVKHLRLSLSLCLLVEDLVLWVWYAATVEKILIVILVKCTSRWYIRRMDLRCVCRTPMNISSCNTHYKDTATGHWNSYRATYRNALTQGCVRKKTGSNFHHCTRGDRHGVNGRLRFTDGVEFVTDGTCNFVSL